MNQDLFYIYDKLTKTRSALGEIQSDFNMSLVIDGTKDSMKVIVWSFNGAEVEPNTICQHQETNTWWIVKRDRVERHLSDNNKFIYIHNLQVEGAIELFNVRDLTDCGFNQKTYTIRQFINRLISLSSLEFSVNLSAPTNFLDQRVDFVKTFENYTPLSALRELLDGYNMCAKATFNTNTAGTNVLLSSIALKVLPKTGDTTLESHNMSEFNDVRETKALDSNSFGTTVVSNAENVMSSMSKTFPSTGSIKASGTEYRILAQNGVIRLPSNVYKGNWLKLVFPLCYINVRISYGGNAPVWYTADQINIVPFNRESFNTGIHNMLEHVRQDGSQGFYDELNAAIGNELEDIFTKVNDCGCATLFNGCQVNPVTGSIEKGENVPYLCTFRFYSKVTDPIVPYIFCDEETKSTLPRKWQGIQWKRGSNIISGFDGFQADEGKRGEIQVTNKYATDFQKYGGEYDDTIFMFEHGSDWFEIRFGLSSDTRYDFMHFTGGENVAKPVHFIVNYIPMSDIKMKTDNQTEKRDTQLYNQNGKLTDSVALSKLINSYSKEISTDTITRYKAYRNFNSIPKVGSIVHDTNDDYVISNVSMDFSQNEKDNTHFGYYIECEFTMSKAIAVKSIMVNPNTNIRDYGIPQSFNVKRKQVYRDYYEMDYTAYTDADTNYLLSPSQIITFGHTVNTKTNFVCAIQCQYGEEVEGSYYWHYQLEATTYPMCKMLYIVCDFMDNNIIGYANQNVYSGFNITRVFSGSYDDINTPISYVDSKGQVESIRVKFCTNEQITAVYDTYQQAQTGGDSYEGSLYNYSCFIPGDIYSNCEYSMKIEENNYNKDAIEVPVFEYACQLDDSKRVLIGDNVLIQRENCVYLYSYETGDNLNQYTAFTNSRPTNNYCTLSIAQGVEITNGESSSKHYLDINVCLIQSMDLSTLEVTNGTFRDIPLGHDIAIFRHAYNTITGEITTDLMFICKNVTPYQLLNSTTIRLQLNHYKLD